MAKFSSTMSAAGRNRLAKIEAQNRLLSQPRVEMYLVGTGGRSEVDNIIIARSQAKDGRNPFVISIAEVNVAHGEMAPLLAKFSANADPKALEAVLSKMGETFLKRVDEHFQGRQGGGRWGNASPRTLHPMRALSPGWSKRRKPGPILVQTGALRSSLRFRILT